VASDQPKATRRSTPRETARSKPVKSTSTNKSPTKRMTRSRMAQPQGEVVVRMYNVGFGDCFLVEYPGPGDYTCRILIDCGTIATGSISMPDVVETLLADVRDPDGRSRIDIVVCTHRHADHVSGFARPEWKDLLVKEVWFPWTEDPKSDEAKHIREAQSRLAAALTAHWQARLAADANDAAANRWLDLAMNALSNASAMNMLHSGFKAKPERRYLSSDGSPCEIESDALCGANAFVLGPSKDKATIQDMNPPAGTTYLRQFVGEQTGEGSFEPFGQEWLIKPEAYRWSQLMVNGEDEASMQEAAQAWSPAVAVALEQAVNGTSLVLAFEIEDVVLFFPGDAQWGTWNALLRNSRTHELLSRARFWKVGHHGSHNATPIEFVESHLSAACCAMMSTRTGKFSSIPRQPLLDAIAAKGIALARSDMETPTLAKPFSRNRASLAEARFPIAASE
jgi:beta-lactamase superfamily II metal-dependent hydrolase